MVLQGNNESKGDLIAGRYRIDEVLAEGGMSVLFCGKDLVSGMPIAVKRLRTADFAKAKNRRRFEHEMQTVSRLRHPNIVQVMDSGADEHGAPYLVMELLSGISLRAELVAQGKLPVEQALQWLLPLFGALSHAHDFGVVHRDLKPANIFLSRDERGRVTPKLLDFGISRLTDATRITRSGMVVGTIQYMSPEQVKDEPVVPATDVWAMGVVLFHCVAGTPPFSAGTAASLLHKIVSRPAPNLLSAARGAGARFGAAVDRALAKELSRRYPDLRAFARALCLSAHADGIALPEAPDPIGLPDWPQWHLAALAESSVTEEMQVAQPKAGQPELEQLPGPAPALVTEGEDRETDIASSFTGMVQLKLLAALVGRQQETEELLQAFHRASRGCPQVVSIVGEAGVGKSRLLWEMTNRIASGSCHYLQGAGHQQYGSSKSYEPILQLLRSYFRIKPGDDHLAIRQILTDKILELDKSLSDCLPALSELFFLDASDESQTLQPQDRKLLVWQALQRLLLRISHDKPLVLAVEDLHWVDKSSREFIDFLVTSLADAPILMVLLYRPGYSHNWGRLPHHSEIELRRLDRSENTALLQSILGQDGAPDSELRDLVWSYAQGNPFFVEEVIRILLETGTIQERGRRYSLQVPAFRMPAGGNVQDIIGCRIDRLEQTAKRTLQVASVADPGLFSHVLQRISGIQDELDTHLKKLERMQFLRIYSVGGESAFAFKHALIQQTAYESLPRDKRREIHARTAGALEETYGNSLGDLYEILAYHYVNAADWEKAGHYSELSGEKAARGFNYETAVQFYLQAISALDNLPPTQDRQKRELHLRILLNVQYIILAHPHGSLENMQQMERLSKAAGDSRSLAISYCALNSFYSKTGNEKKSTAFAELAVEEALRAEDVELMCPVVGFLFINYMVTGEWRKMLEVGPRAAGLLEKTGKTHDPFNFFFVLYPWICMCCGLSAALRGDFREGELYMDKAWAAAAHKGDVPTLGLVEVGYCSLSFYRGCGNSTIEHAKEGLKYLERAGWLTEIPIVLTFLAFGYFFLGDLQTAKQNMETACENISGSFFAVFRYLPCLGLSFVCGDLGEDRKALEMAEKALRIAKDTGDPMGEAVSLAQLAVAVGRTDPSQYLRAEQYVDQAIDMLDRLGLRLLSTLEAFVLARLYAGADQRQKALERFDDLQAGMGEMEKLGLDFWLRDTRKHLSQLLGPET